MPKRTGYAKINVLQYHNWIHDEMSKTFSKNQRLSAESTKPNFTNMWFDATISGDTVQFTDDDGKQHTINIASPLRGINIEAVVVFDLDNEVLVFF